MDGWNAVKQVGILLVTAAPLTTFFVTVKTESEAGLVLGLGMLVGGTIVAWLGGGGRNRPCQCRSFLQCCYAE